MTEIQCTVLAYRDNIIKSLYELQQQNYLCDVEISTTDGTVYVHKVVLAICESSILHESVSKAGKDSVRGKISCDEYCIEVVESLVRYLYTGEIKVTEKHVHDFSKLCQSFNLKNALDAFINHMIHQNIAKGTSQDGSHLSVSMETCKNLSTLSAAAHTISTIGSFDSLKKIIEQSGLCTSTKEKCSEKRDTVEKENVKIEDSAKRGKEDEKYIENEDDDTQDLDLQEYDKMIKCNSSDDHQQVIIKVENMEGGFDEKSNKLSNSPGMAENSNASMFLMSSENNPCLESPDVQKRSPGSSKTKTKPKTNAPVKNSKIGKGTLKIRIKKNNFPAGENLPEKSKELIPKRKRGIKYRWCRKCNLRLSENDLKRHMRQNHPPYSCELCDWTGLLKRDMALHMYNKHQILIMPDQYPLLQCDHQVIIFCE